MLHLVGLVLVGALAPTPGGGGSPGGVDAAPAKRGVQDEIVLTAPAGQTEGLRIVGRVKSIDQKEKRLWVVVNWGTNEGPISVLLERVKRIDYDIDGRREELPAGDNLARYRLALWALEVGLRDAALADLEIAAGKTGVPDEALGRLAGLLEEKQRPREALAAWKKFLEKKPGDAAAAAAVKRLEEAVAKLPPDKAPDVNPDPNPEGPGPEARPPAEDSKNNMEARQDWAVQPWGNPADLTWLKDEKTANQFMVVSLPGTGPADKTAVGLRVNGDMSQRSKFIFNVYNGDAKAVPVSVAFVTSNFFETQYKFIKPGWNMAVAIDLNASDFKCSPDWAHNAQIKDKNAVKMILFLVNVRNKKATLYLDNVHFE